MASQGSLRARGRGHLVALLRKVGEEMIIGSRVTILGSYGELLRHEVADVLGSARVWEAELFLPLRFAVVAHPPELNAALHGRSPPPCKGPRHRRQSHDPARWGVRVCMAHRPPRQVCRAVQALGAALRQYMARAPRQ